ncbi:UNVERIFIED_CONTAM: hypothetical protein K2H54_059163 [Gekko kuhli]
MAPPGTEGAAGAAELASTMQGLREAFEQLSEKVDKMSRDAPAKRARTVELPSTPPRQGRGHKEGRSRTAASLQDESDTEDSSGEVGPAGDRKQPPSEYWATVAHEPVWAIHRRALAYRAGGNPGVVWDEVDVGDPSSILSTYSNGEEPPGLHLSEELRDSILDGYYVNVFTLLQKRGTEARMLKSDKKEKKERSEEAERTFLNWVSGYLVYAGVVATAYPERGWHLLNHMSNVVEARVLAGEGAAIDYDETCRKLASRNERALWDLLQDKVCLRKVGLCIKGKSEIKPDRWSGRKDRSRAFVGNITKGDVAGHDASSAMLASSAGGGGHGRVYCTWATGGQLPFRNVRPLSGSANAKGGGGPSGTAAATNSRC